MQPRDWFGVAVRLLALYCIFMAINAAFYVVVKFIEVETTSKLPMSTSLFSLFFHLLAAWAILRKANTVVDFTYGSADKS